MDDIVDSSPNPNRIDRKREGGWTGSSRQDIPKDTRVPDDSPRDSEGDQSRENGGENSEVFPTDETFDGDR